MFLKVIILFQTALSIFFQDAAIPTCPQGASTHFGQVGINARLKYEILTLNNFKLLPSLPTFCY